MPDSFTKFEEDEPTASSSSGGSTDDSSDDSSDDDEAEDTSDIVYTISSVDVYQSADDIIMFYASDVDNFRVGDSLNIATSVIGPGTYESSASVYGIYRSNDDLYYIMAVQLSSLLVSDDYYIQNGYYIDNCATGYGTCATGSTGSAIVESDPIFYVPSTGITAGSYNFQKHIEVTGTSSSGYSTANLEFDYDFSPEQPQGIGMDEGTSGDQTDDEIVSPYGPFLPTDELAYLGDIDSDDTLGSLTITVSVNSSYYGDSLDDVETSSVDVNLSSSLPDTSLEESTADELTYYIPDSQAIAIIVSNTSGYVVGDTIVSCRTSTTANCSSYSDGYIDGVGTIYAINQDLGVLYLTTSYADGASINSLFPDSNYIYDSAQGFLSTQEGEPQIILSTSVSGWTLSPIWNDYADGTDDPTGISYSVTEGGFDGLSFNASTGVLTVTGSEYVSNSVVVTAYDSSTGEEVDSYQVDINILGTATSLRAQVDLDSTTYYSTYAMQTTINQTDNIYVLGITGSDFPSSTGDYGLGLLSIALTADGDGSPYTFPTGAALSAYDNVTKQITFTPSTYIDGTTTYELSLYHPALSGTTVIDTLNMTFESGSSFDYIIYPQYTGDKLILGLDDVSYFDVNDLAVTDENSVSTITYIDTNSNRIFVTLNGDYNGEEVFKVGDTLDTTNPFVSERATIESVVRVYDTADPDDRFTDTLSDDTTEFNPSLFDENGDAVSVSTGEVTWAISPSLPSGLTFHSDTGIIEADTANTLPVYSETEFTVSATNAVGDTATHTFTLSIGQSPTNATLARYQFIRLNSNNSRFYRGSRASTGVPDDAGEGYVAPSARVLFPIDIDNDDVSDGMLLENFGDFEDGLDVDNTASYFASEGTVDSYLFLYVEDVTDFASGEEIDGTYGGVGTIQSTPGTTNNILYVKVKSGDFSVGETLTEPGGTTTKIKSIEDRHYISTVLEIPTGSVSSFVIGDTLTDSQSSVDYGTGTLVNIHYASSSAYLLVRHLSGYFQQGHTVAGQDGGSATISSIVGPNVKVLVTGGTNDDVSSGYTNSTSDADPLFEGMPVTQYTSGNVFVTSGYVVAGTDFDSNEIVINVEDFRTPFTYASGSYLDDTSDNSGSAAALTNKVTMTGVRDTNLMIGYVGELFHLEPSIEGDVSAASLDPETLPNGLEFDTSTGLISGEPSESFTLTDYTVTFTSSNGSSATYDFSIVIYNQFEISQLTDGASSYILHKEGRGYANSRCKVFGPQVIDDVSDDNYGEAIMGFNDVVCILDGGEADIYNSGINFQIQAGGGMCEYVEFVPYSYRQYLPGDTTRTVVTYNSFSNASSCGAGDAYAVTELAANENNVSGPAVDDGYVVAQNTGAANEGAAIASYGNFGSTYCQSGDCVQNELTSPSVCSFDHNTTGLTNVDGGSIKVITVSCSYTETSHTDSSDDEYTETDCYCDYEETIVQCGGNADENYSGAKLEVPDIPADKGSEVTEAYSGVELSYELSAPIDVDDATNSYLANYTDFDSLAGGGTCFGGTYQMDNYNGVGSLATNYRSEWESFAGEYDPFGDSNEGTMSNFYTFNCLDSAYNIKARIRVFVRDWDEEVAPDNDLREQLSPASKMDNPLSNGFGQDYDSVADIDSLWNTLISDYPANSNGSPYRTSCSSTTATFQTVVSAGTEVSMELGFARIQTDAGIVEVIPRGSVLRYRGSDGTDLYFMTTDNAYPGDTEIAISVESYITDSNTGTAALQMARKNPFPLPED